MHHCMNIEFFLIYFLHGDGGGCGGWGSWVEGWNESFAQSTSSDRMYRLPLHLERLQHHKKCYDSSYKLKSFSIVLADLWWSTGHTCYIHNNTIYHGLSMWTLGIFRIRSSSYSSCPQLAAVFDIIKECLSIRHRGAENKWHKNLRNISFTMLPSIPYMVYIIWK